MKNPQKNDCENVVELLVKDYSAKFRSDLGRKISSISADFINQGLFNSTVMVTKQMGAEFEYLDGLVNYVIGSLKKDFGHIPLGSCKDKLVAILETEYKKLIPFANSLLVKAGLANQASLDSFQRRILDELEKANEKVEIQCAIAEKQKAADREKIKGKKWYQSRTIQAALITGGFMLVAALLTSPLWIPFINKLFGGSGNGTKISTTPETSGESSPVIDVTGPNNTLTIDHDSRRSKQVRAKPVPLVKKEETLIEPEETEADVNKLKTVYEPGAALLEIFKLKGHESSLEDIPELPVIRTYWKRDLTCSSSFLLPERLAEVGEGSAYVGKFSFYYEAKQPGKYGFTIQHHEDNGCMLKIGGVTIMETALRKPICQGVCNLEKGFHRIEFWLGALTEEKWLKKWEGIFSERSLAAFQVKVLTPDAFDAVPLTKEMMLLKKE